MGSPDAWDVAIFPNCFAGRRKYDAKLGGPMTYGYRIDAIDAA
jgi:hypothetical protein